MANELGGFAVVRDAAAPDILADDVVSFELIQGTVRISLAVAKMAEGAAPSPMHQVIIGRLVMGIPGAQRLALGLYDYLKNQGLDPAALVSGSEKAAN